MYRLLVLFLLSTLSSFAQEPVYNQMKSNYQFRGIRVDSLLLFPKFSDTSLANGTIHGSVIRVGNTIYLRDTLLKKWVGVQGGGSTDTTNLSNRINGKVDSVTRVSDSVKYWKNGIAYFAFKDSVGGGNLTLNQVTGFGNTTQNNIEFINDADLQMDTFSSVLLANNSRLQEGTIDAGYGGNKGIAQICGLGYELKWEGGMLFSMGSSGNTIREARYMFNLIPQDTNDISEGYQVGSRWVLDNGDTYECTDNTNGAAVWVLQQNSGQNGRWGNDTALIILAKVRNATATTMARGTVVVLNGAIGDVASVIRANNKYDSTSATTIGLVKDPIAAGDTGWVVTQGQASKLNLGSFTSGDALYLDSLDGGLTKNKPIAPYHQVFVCIVERANSGNGLAYVKPQNGQELGELHDVWIVSPLNNQVLVYSDTQQIWKNRNVYSVVDTTSLSNRINNLTLNDVVSNNNVTTSSIFVSSPFGINDPISETYGEINYYNREFSLTDDNYDTILKTYKNTLVLYDSLGNTATIKTLNFGDDVVITLPDASGQLMTYTYANSTFLAKLDTTNMLKNYQRTSAFPIATFGAGSGAAGDTSAFTTAAIYGSFYLNAGSDTIIVTGYTGVVQGTSASVTPTIYFNDTLNVAGTKIVNSPSAVTSTTTGNTVTSLDNTKIPPGNFVWVKTETVTTKPTYFNLTLIGYRKR